MNQNKTNEQPFEKFSAFRKSLVLGGLAAAVTGMITYKGVESKIFGTDTAIAIVVMVVIAFCSLLFIWITKTISNAKTETEASFDDLKVNGELSANEIIYQNLIENSGVVMYTTSVEGIITFSSSKAFFLTGYTLDELLGMHFTKLIDADWLEEVVGIYKNQFKNKIEETVNEFCIRSKYGDLKWVEQSAILILENNIPKGFQCIVKEISKRKEMENVLRKYELEIVQNQDRLQSILDNATSLMYLKDLEGRYLVINKQFRAALNVTDSTVIGKTDFDFADSKAAMRYKYSDEEVIRTGKPVELEEVIEMADGKHSILITKFPLLDAQNNVYGISGIATDITERVKYEEQLIQAKKIAEDAKKMQEQFLANMSHEIRTPMNGIQGMTDLLLETGLDKDQKDFALTIKRSSDNLLVIINDILDFSKIQAGKLTLEKIDFNLREIAENIKAIFKHKLDAKGLFFELKLDEAIPSSVNGDPYRLNQILVNLIGNAVKFTHNGGIIINIALRDKSPTEMLLEFNISDTGIGIENASIDSIFESFTQASIETSRKYGGTGLGLAITRQLLELQRGTIAVESKIDAGTTFSFTIPYGYSLTESQSYFAGKDSKDYRGMLLGKKFLVAEDNEVNQKVIRHVLKKAGGTVEIANNGAEAVAMLQKNANYDLIIMDLQMPEMDGYTATQFIRREMQLSTPIIAMTASALKGERVKCLEIGMNDYLSKPFDFNYLYQRIHQLLSKAKPLKITHMPNETDSGDKPFDLSQLEEMDDNDYVAEILTAIFANIPRDLSMLKKACVSQDYAVIGKIAHKLKGSAGIIQATGLIKILVKIDEFSKAEISEGLTILADQAGEAYKKIENPLKEYLKNISSGNKISI